MKNLVIIIALVVGLSSTTLAQKFGYVNSAEILKDFPDVQQAESNMESLQKVLQKKYQQSLEALQTKATTFQQAVQAGDLSLKDQEDQGKKLKEEEMALAQTQQDMIKQMEEKRQELLEPIYAKINDAIKAVASENGYQFIFEKGVLLYADEGQNVTPLVKKKLGM